MTQEDLWKAALKDVEASTAQQVIGELSGGGRANKARRLLSAHCARAEQASADPIEMRRQEFITIFKIHAALEGVDL